MEVLLRNRSACLFVAQLLSSELMDLCRLLISATVSCGGEHKSNLGFVDLPNNFLLYDMYAIFCNQALIRT